MPNTSIVGQIVSEILVPFCFDNFIQILSKFYAVPNLLMLRTESNLEEFVGVIRA